MNLGNRNYLPIDFYGLTITQLSLHCFSSHSASTSNINRFYGSTHVVRQEPKRARFHQRLACGHLILRCRIQELCPNLGRNSYRLAFAAHHGDQAIHPQLFVLIQPAAKIPGEDVGIPNYQLMPLPNARTALIDIRHIPPAAREARHGFESGVPVR